MVENISFTSLSIKVLKSNEIHWQTAERTDNIPPASRKGLRDNITLLLQFSVLFHW